MSLSVQLDISPDPDVTLKLLGVILRGRYEPLAGLLSGTLPRLAAVSGQALEAVSLPTAGQRGEAHPDFRQGSGTAVEQLLAENLGLLAIIRESFPGHRNRTGGL